MNNRNLLPKLQKCDKLIEDILEEKRQLLEQLMKELESISDKIKTTLGCKKVEFKILVDSENPTFAYVGICVYFEKELERMKEYMDKYHQLHSLLTEIFGDESIISYISFIDLIEQKEVIN